MLTSDQKHYWILAGSILVVGLVHLLALVHAPIAPWPSGSKSKSKPIQFKVVQKKVPRPAGAKKIFLDNRLQKTKAPNKADYIGMEDHKAKKQQQSKRHVIPDSKTIKKKPSVNPSKQPPQKKHTKGKKKQSANKSSKNGKSKVTKKSRLTDPNGTVRIDKPTPYEKFLLGNSKVAVKEVVKGYKQRIERRLADSNLPDGIETDVDIKKFRLAGYFVHIQNAVEGANFPPSAAKMRRHIRGSAGMFSAFSKAFLRLNEKGEIVALKILDSSGHAFINRHWESILRQAAPFPPLPKNSGLKKLEFSYNYLIQRSRG